jgi:hypothetical protein
MALQIGRALGRGFRRSASLSGLVVLVFTMITQFGILGSVNTVIVNLLPDGAQPSDIGTIGFTLPVSTEIAAAIGTVSLLVSTGLFLFAARLLSRDITSLNTLPGSVFTRRLGRAFLSTILVSLVLAIVLPLGFLLFLIPGVFLAVSFQFVVFAVAVEDAGPIDALRRSWGLASGNRWRLFGLVFILAAVSGVSGMIGTVFGLANPLVGQLLSLALNSVFLVFMYGVLADAFVQLRDGPLSTVGGTSGTTHVESL